MTGKDWIDEDGYPTDEALERIKDWPYADFSGLFEFVAALWKWPNYLTAEDDRRTYRFATGGWSGNESLIGALNSNVIARLMCWEASFRGGLTYWRLPRLDEVQHEEDAR